MRVVLDTDVLVAGMRSKDGASHALLNLVGRGRFELLASVTLFMEYEAVLTRAEHLLAGAMQREEILAFLDHLANHVTPVDLHYLWRPQLDDIGDEMVLETAINGQANILATFNAAHFKPATRFGIDVVPPRELLRKVR